MAIAGKVAITPKGEWNANTAYTKLDLVFYENASYVAIQPSTGVTPTNTAYWMLVVQSAGGADLEAIIDGTTQVGNAKKLDGHEVDDFAKKDDLSDFVPLIGQSVVQNAGTTPLGVKNTSSNLIFIPFYGSSGLLGYIGFEGADALSFLPKDGSGTKRILHSGNVESYALPLTGGTVNGSIGISYSGGTMFYLIAKESNSAFMQFRGKDGTLGYLGFSGANAPTLLNNSGGTLGTLLHTGNKPTGTYTGNGSVAQRTINTGGIGEFAFVKCGVYRFTVLSEAGYIGFDGTSVVCGTDAYFVNGKIIESTTSALFNESGKTYTYQIP